MAPTDDYWDEAAVLVLSAIRLAEAALSGHENGRHWFAETGGAKARYELAGLAIAMVTVDRIEAEADEEEEDDDDDAVAQIARRIEQGINPAGVKEIAEGDEYDLVLYERVTEYLRIYTEVIVNGDPYAPIPHWASRLKLLLDASTLPGPVRHQFTMVVGDFFEEMPRRMAVDRCVARIMAPVVLATLKNARSEGGDICRMREAVLAPLIEKHYDGVVKRMEDRASSSRPPGLIRRFFDRFKG